MGSGKTVLVRHILESTRNHIVYDPMNEYAGMRRYVPDDRQSIGEMNKFVETFIIPTRPRLFVIDEGNKYIQNRKPLPSAIAEMNDLSRHWNITWGLVSRRPAQMATDVVELAHHLFIFALHGKNDRQYLNDLKAGLGDTVDALPPYYFAAVDERRSVTVHAPVNYRATIGLTM